MDLKKKLKYCWQQIEIIYNDGRICSERHMQAELFSLLLNQNETNENFQIFVEPSIYGDNQYLYEIKLNGIIPDLIITENNEIVCVIELKYNPTGYIEYGKDLTNLGKFASIMGYDYSVYLETNPKDGDWNYDRPFRVSKSLLIVYAIIANEYSDAITKANEIWNNSDFFQIQIKNKLFFIGAINKIKADFYVIE